MDISTIIEQERIPRLSLPGIDLKDTISFQNSLSSGVNKLSIPQLYHYQFGNSIVDWKMLHNYTSTMGSPLLAEAIKTYEKISTLRENDEPNSSFEYICITTGASAAIAFFLGISRLSFHRRRYCY